MMKLDRPLWRLSVCKTGKRFNSGKLRWRNLPPFLVKPMIEVGQFGEKKYGTYNFLKGLPTLDTLDSLQRHLDAVLDPEQSDYDEESGCHHLAHIAWNSIVALHHLQTRPELDDRWKGPNAENKVEVTENTPREVFYDAMKKVTVEHYDALKKLED